MEFETLKFERHGKIGVLKISRPKVMNALNAQVINDLAQFLDKLKSESDLRCLVITGDGEKAFVAGADINEMQELNKEQALELSERGQKVFQTIENLRIPSIAAVNGFALGGGLELALSCDFMIVSEKAKLGLPEVSLGLIPGYGGTQRLARCVGKGVARAMILSGNMFTADQALEWGLVVEITKPELLMDRALNWAKDISSRGPAAVSLAKRAINEGFDKNLFEAMKLESELFSNVFETQDQKEGITAFVEKRAPEFTGK